MSANIHPKWIAPDSYVAAGALAAPVIPMNRRGPDQVAPNAQQAAEFRILPLLEEVLDEFRRQNISYCYWKSSRRIHCVLTGESDLDLLVGRDDVHRIQLVLLDRGFRLFPSVPYRDHPAISSYLGYDETSGRLVHLHLHFRLIVGERLLKNFRTPWEEAILARALVHQTFPIRILDPVSEALLWVVRSCLELRWLDPITLRDWQATKQKFLLDRATLAARVDRSSLVALAGELLTAELAEMVADAVYDTNDSRGRRRLRRGIRTHFAAYRSYNGFEVRMRSFGRMVLWTAGSLNRHVLNLPRPWRRRTPGGGRVAAVIGVDGSGKSTVVAALRAWLGSEVDVLPIYFGTGDGRPSVVLWPFKILVPWISKLLKTKPKGASHGKISNAVPGRLYGVLLMVWATVVAIEKRIKLRTAHRGANRGLFILTDRYPQNEIIGFNDGPLLTRLTTIPHWLARFEDSTYALAHRLPPDLVIRLDVTPETALQREPNMDPTVVRERIVSVRRLVFPGARVVNVDAEQPLEDVIRTVKREIWRLL